MAPAAGGCLDAAGRVLMSAQSADNRITTPGRRVFASSRWIGSWSISVAGLRKSRRYL